MNPKLKSIVERIKKPGTRILKVIDYPFKIGLLVAVCWLFYHNTLIVSKINEIISSVKYAHRKIQTLQSVNNILTKKIKEYQPVNILVIADNISNQPVNAIYFASNRSWKKSCHATVSQDLWRHGWTFGRQIAIDQLGIFTVRNVVQNHQKKQQIIIYCWEPRRVWEIGSQIRKVQLLAI